MLSRCCRGMCLQHTHTHCIHKTVEEGKKTHCGKFIKLSKQLVQQLDQFLGCTLGGQTGETNNICKQDAVRETEEKDRRMHQYQLFIAASYAASTKQDYRVPDWISSEEFLLNDTWGALAKVSLENLIQ